MTQLLYGAAQCKTFTAEGTINPYRIVKVGAAEGGVLEATAETEALLGVIGNVTVLIGESVEVIMMGVAKVHIDGTPAIGSFITAATGGKGAAAAPAAGVNNNVIGRILKTAADEEVCDVFLCPGTLQGAGLA